MLQVKLRNHLARFAVTLLLLGVVASVAYPGQPVIWETNSRAECRQSVSQTLRLFRETAAALGPKAIYTHYRLFNKAAFSPDAAVVSAKS